MEALLEVGAAGGAPAARDQTVVYRYPAEEAVPILVDAAFITAPTLRHLREIRFVVTGGKMLALFETAIARQRG